MRTLQIEFQKPGFFKKPGFLITPKSKNALQ
jgi:hypothetical protein